MGQQVSYKCQDCGFEFENDGVSEFYIDNEYNQLHEFLPLIIPNENFSSSKIKGRIYKTYCNNCKRNIKVYSIKESSKSDAETIDIVKKALKMREQAIKRRINSKYEIRIEYEPLIEIHDKEYNNNIKYVSMLDYSTKEEALKEAENELKYLQKTEIDHNLKKLENEKDYILDVEIAKEDLEDFYLDKKDQTVDCPVCNKKLARRINHQSPCPECNGELKVTNLIYLD